ncbi:FecR family protein [Desertivirga brevis]|uniref:FecR family protein n=1 Tax=Desertivirga brevis TaxID=2810310 RepID=UPI001A96943D|nr:FecR domain-containing protein [Pedobacter sp. SYSU D00873]
MNTGENTEKLFDKYLKGTYSLGDFHKLQEQFSTDGNREQILDYLDKELNAAPIENEYYSARVRALVDRTDKVIAEKISIKGAKGNEYIKLWNKVLIKYAAAALLILSTLGIYLSRNLKEQRQVADHSANVRPGTDRAVLTLADGRIIELDKTASGELAKDGGTIILGLGAGDLAYQASKNSTDTASLNTLSTPAGGQYKILLSDGTVVWMNSSSSITYPVQFGNTRKVRVSGEVYFEVAKRKSNNVRSPFIVETKDQEIRVLGTHFNVNAYTEESWEKTTLLEGSVLVSLSGRPSKNILKPGEQVTLSRDRNLLQISAADTEAATAWKNGYFIFAKEDLGSIMRKVERWYDVKVSYDQINPEALRFGGIVSRSKSIKEVLQLMESTGKVHFEINGRRVVVMR